MRTWRQGWQCDAVDREFNFAYLLGPPGRTMARSLSDDQFFKGSPPTPTRFHQASVLFQQLRGRVRWCSSEVVRGFSKTEGIKR
ncbi:hypothetical protein NL676_009850 [Syzygium grande]|nr:hypothetical protein NL676_009850 [Syzygium grande]